MSETRLAFRRQAWKVHNHSHLLRLLFRRIPYVFLVLDGVDEGVYGWVTVNAKALANQGAAEQVGSLDWGGASSQISFPATDFIATEDDHVRNVKVFEKVNKVYSVSQLCYGQNSALQRYFIQVMSKQ